MKNRREWLSDIYMDMTGTPPPDTLWDTPSGQMISENNPALLYDQPTANLYQIVYELPQEIRAEVFRLIRVREEPVHHQGSERFENGQNNEKLFKQALTRSVLRVSPYRNNMESSTAHPLRYTKPADHELRAKHWNRLRNENERRKKDNMQSLRKTLGTISRARYKDRDRKRLCAKV